MVVGFITMTEGFEHLVEQVGELVGFPTELGLANLSVDYHNEFGEWVEISSDSLRPSNTILPRVLKKARSSNAEKKRNATAAGAAVGEATGDGDAVENIASNTVENENDQHDVHREQVAQILWKNAENDENDDTAINAQLRLRAPFAWTPRVRASRPSASTQGVHAVSRELHNAEQSDHIIWEDADLYVAQDVHDADFMHDESQKEYALHYPLETGIKIGRCETPDDRRWLTVTMPAVPEDEKTGDAKDEAVLGDSGALVWDLRGDRELVIPLSSICAVQRGGKSPKAASAGKPLLKIFSVKYMDGSNIKFLNLICKSEFECRVWVFGLLKLVAGSPNLHSEIDVHQAEGVLQREITVQQEKETKLIAHEEGGETKGAGGEEKGGGATKALPLLSAEGLASLKQAGKSANGDDASDMESLQSEEDQLDVEAAEAAAAAEAVVPFAGINGAAPAGLNEANAVSVKALRAIFDHTDKDGTGTINVREMILGLRKDKTLQALLHLPAHIRQEDGTRDAFERIFQAMDTHQDRKITFGEFKDHIMAWKDEEGVATPALPAVDIEVDEAIVPLLGIGDTAPAAPAVEPVVGVEDDEAIVPLVGIGGPGGAPVAPAVVPVVDVEDDEAIVPLVGIGGPGGAPVAPTAPASVSPKIAPADANAVLHEAMKTIGEISIEMDFDDMIKAGKETFEAAFVKDMAEALGIPEDNILVEELTAGSVMVAFALTNGPGGADAIQALTKGPPPDFSQTATAMGVESLASSGLVVTKWSTPEDVDAAQASLRSVEMEKEETGAGKEGGAAKPLSFLDKIKAQMEKEEREEANGGAPAETKNAAANAVVDRRTLLRQRPPMPGLGQHPHAEWLTTLFRKQTLVAEDGKVEYCVQDMSWDEPGDVTAWSVAADRAPSARVKAGGKSGPKKADSGLAGLGGSLVRETPRETPTETGKEGWEGGKDIEIVDVLNGAKDVGNAVMGGAKKAGNAMAKMFGNIASLAKSASVDQRTSIEDAEAKLLRASSIRDIQDTKGRVARRVYENDEKEEEEEEEEEDKPTKESIWSKRGGKSLWKLAKKAAMGPKKFHLAIKDKTADDLHVRVAREAWFYKTFPQEAFSRPTLYYADYFFPQQTRPGAQELPERMIVLMEDMRTRTIQLDRVHSAMPYDADESLKCWTMAFVAIADTHAKYWGLGNNENVLPEGVRTPRRGGPAVGPQEETNHLKGSDWYVGKGEADWTLAQRSARRAMNLLEQEDKRKCDPRFLDMMKNTLEKSTFEGAVAEMNARPTTLVHGDFQASNVFLEELEQKIYMVDFSEVGVGDPFSDLVQYVITDIPINERRKYEMQVLQAYWARLTSKRNKTGHLCVDPAEFPFTRCVELYKTAIDRWLWLFPVIGAMFEYKPVFYFRQIHAFIEDHCAELDFIQMRSVTEMHEHVGTYLYHNPPEKTCQRLGVRDLPMAHLLNPRAGKKNMML